MWCAVRPHVRFLAPLLALALLAGVLSARPAEAAVPETGPVEYVHPVDAPVLDPFRAPMSRYGPGNRGLEYATGDGDVVAAAGPGVVTFAGEIAATRHVSIRHPDGRVSSYSFLRDVEVVVGEHVGRGERVGVAGGPVHVGLREAGEYVDPALFFGVEVTSVRLVAEDEPGGERWQRAQDALELALIAQLEHNQGLNPLRAAVDGFRGGIDEIRSAIDAALPLLLEIALALGPIVVAAIAGPFVAVVVFGVALPILMGENPVLLELLREGPIDSARRLIGRSIEWWRQRSSCTPADVEPPPPEGRRLAVLVAGLDSTSDDAAIADLPVDELGYAPGDVVGFSYAGGRTPDAFGDGEPVAADLGTLPVAAYDREDSSTDLSRRGDHLADLLTDIARTAPPGTVVDLFAHSQGGIVVRLALAELSERPGGAEVIASLGLVATMGTPHQGADLATMAVAASETGEGAIVLGIADELLDRSLDPDDATNLVDLARGSNLLDGLAAGGLPDGPSYLSIAGRGDPVVLADRTRLAGATNVLVGVDGLTAHGRIPGDPETAREIALARAGLDPTCVGFFGFVGDVVVTESLHIGTTVAGQAVADWATMSILPELFGELLVRDLGGSFGDTFEGWYEDRSPAAVAR